MLFNSYEFCLLFVPLTLLAYSLACRCGGRTFALGWLLLASVFFYGWSSSHTLTILAFSILLNYSAARLLTHARSVGGGRSRFIVGLGVGINLLILGQFKYLEFLVEAGAALVGINMPLVRSIPPLAISFFTFQQIAYLVDVYRGHAAERNLVRYGLFVCFFPQLIAGPIVHHKDMLAQFRRPSLGLQTQDLAMGVTLFIIGLFKKVVIADTVVNWLAPVFAAAAGGSLGTLDAWTGALAYTLQLYFDFSGYCDMAIGLGLMFGFRLPLNFNSPYQATSIIDFWRRWHQTLSRFLRDYLYIGLGGNRNGRSRRYINLMVTMLIGGLWHGANWTFLVWGGLHGSYLVLNHTWRGLLHRFGLPAPVGFWWQCVSRALTFVAVMLAWVFFRSDSIGSALYMLGVMAGLGSPEVALGSISVVDNAILFFDQERIFALLGLLAVVSFAPNSQQIVGYVGLAGYGARRRADVPAVGALNDYGRRLLRWKPTAPWAAITALLCLISMFGMSEAREFVYFRF